MRKLLWIGNHFFVYALKQCASIDVTYHQFNGFQIFTWQDLVALAGGPPDILVVADKSLPPFVLGMESFPCLTIFYVVDSHLHSWYPNYAQAFDGCLISLKDHLPLFAGAFLPQERLRWFPPFAQDALRPKEPEPAKEWDCLFVGSVNDQTPLRKRFLEELGQKLAIHVTFGDFAKLFPKARVVLNFCEHGDLNFRVFEALGLESCLLTPRIENGQEKLFTNKEHFLLFDAESVQDCEEKILSLLANAPLRKKLATQGLCAVDAKHRAHHRAEACLKFLESLWPERETIIRTRLQKAPQIRAQELRLPYLLWAKELADPAVKSAYLEASKEAPR